MTSAYDQGAIPPIEVRHRLRIAREYAGLEQAELALTMGVTRSTVSNAENGRGRPLRSTINLWAMACGVPREWIMTGRPPAGGDDPNSGLRIISDQERPKPQARTVTSIERTRRRELKTAS